MRTLLPLAWRIRPSGRFPLPDLLYGKGIYPAGETISPAFPQLAFYHLDPSGEFVELPELRVLVEDVLGRQPPQAAIPGVQEAHQRFYGLHHALREQGKPLVGQFRPPAVEFGLEGRIFAPLIERIPAHPAFPAGGRIRGAGEQDRQKLRLPRRQFRFAVRLSDLVGFRRHGRLLSPYRTIWRGSAQAPGRSDSGSREWDGVRYFFRSRGLRRRHGRGGRAGGVFRVGASRLGRERGARL